MGIFKSEQVSKIIDNTETIVSEVVIVTNGYYSTNGESTILVKNVDHCKLYLDSKTTENITIKSLTNTLIISDLLIDEEFTEVELDKGACVKFKKINNFWYIMSSDGLKLI